MSLDQRASPLPDWLSGARRRFGSRAVAALAALTVATLCISTTENLPSGLLPQMSAGLGVSLFAAGQLVTAYALTVLLCTLPLTHVTRRIARRPLLIGLMALFTLANLGSALAPDYGLLLASRIVTALVHALFWAVVTVVAAGLFAPAVRGRVLAVVNGAASFALVAGVPAGTWIGQEAGWRAAFWAIVEGKNRSSCPRAMHDADQRTDENNHVEFRQPPVALKKLELYSSLWAMCDPCRRKGTLRNAA